MIIFGKRSSESWKNVSDDLFYHTQSPRACVPRTPYLHRFNAGYGLLGRIRELKFKKVDFPVPNTNWKNSIDVLNESGNVNRPRYRSK
ncbi:TPA: hypothetical protein ACFU2Q_002272, partial [Neisseria subflava]